MKPTIQRLSPILAAAALSAASPAMAATTFVVNFDDLPSGRNILMPANYGGINWGGNFYHYDNETSGGYLPASGKTTIYPNYARFPVGSVDPVSFFFDEAVRFDGAFFSGGRTAAPYVAYELFLDGVRVAATGPFSPNMSASFFASGYAGIVDEVRILGNAGFWVMDDVTYTTGITWPPAAVPEPATWAMLICGFAFVGASMRQRRFALVVPQR